MKRHIPWDLLIVHFKNETNSEEEQSVEEWRAAADNEELYKEICSLWDVIIKESSSYNPDTNLYWSVMEARMEAMEKRKKVFSVSLNKIRTSVAAASILLIIAISSSYFFTKNYFFQEIGLQTYKSINGKSQIILPDGSEVWLNIGSTIAYETSFVNNRRVMLEGEALFEVRKDEKNPFIVSASDLQAMVHGTRFNVQAYPDSEEIRVALSEGRVEVSAFEHGLMMFPGEVVTFDRKTNILSKIRGDVAFESFWAGNSHTFDAKPLSFICKHLERWYNIDIELDPAIADSQVYTFTITNESLETILQIMSRINPIRYSFEEDKRVVIKNVSPYNKN